MGQKLQYQAIAKHFSFPEQTAYKKNEINVHKNDKDDKSVSLCIKYLT